MTPHVYSVTQRAYKAMIDDQIDQTILVSGLSGSGKTETAKIAIHYLSRVSLSDSDTLEARINIAGILLESFGNARTVLNGNSSRFGKYTKIHFTEDGKMLGAQITTYLLEKSRVCRFLEKERNFRIFYELFTGLPNTLQKELHLSDNKFKILGPARSDNLSGRLSFEQLTNYFGLLNFSEEDQYNIFKSLSAILHLGNITFEEGGSIVNDENVSRAAEMLGLKTEALIGSLTTIEMTSLSGRVVEYTKSQAELCRDSLAQEVYTRLFNFVVSRINASLLVADEDEAISYISIIDISGYESTLSNGFEQLCINYTNDKLQQIFNEMIYKEQAEYKLELGWEPLDFDMNLRQSLQTLDKKQTGLFALLDEICYHENSVDEDFVRELGICHQNNPAIQVKPPKQFVVNHGPGGVMYDAKEFLIKNRDLLANSIVAMIQQSNNAFLKTMFEATGTRAKSIGSSCMAQMSDLIDAILETDYSFIKCVKPNKNSIADEFDIQYVTDQLQWAGVIETVTLVAKGYPVHIDSGIFVENFGQNDEITALKICQKLLYEKEYAVGKTKVFLSLAAKFKLDLFKRDGYVQGTPMGYVTDLITKTKNAWSWLFPEK